MGFFSIAAPIVGSLVGNAMSSNSANKAATKANAFTEREMKNRHQWEVDDLRSAGLNPILSAGGTPSIGGAAKADVPDSAKDISSGIANAIQAQLAEAQVKNINEQTKTNKTQQDLNKAATVSAQADSILKGASAAQVAAITKNIATEYAGKKAEQQIDESQYGKVLRALGRLNPFASSAKAVSSIGK